MQRGFLEVSQSVFIGEEYADEKKHHVFNMPHRANVSHNPDICTKLSCGVN